MRPFLFHCGTLPLLVAVTGDVAAVTTTARDTVVDPINASQLLQLGGGLIVVLMLIGALYLLRPMLQRLGAVRGPAGKLLSVIDAIHVGPRDRIVLVEVDGQRVLLGVSPGTIRPLLDLGAGRGLTDSGFSGELQSSLRTAREQAS